MIDWTTVIITAISVAAAAGGVGGFLYYKANKGGATADALDKYSIVMEKMLDNAIKQQETSNRMLADKDAIIEQQGLLICEYKAALEESNQENRQIKYKIGELERKFSGVQKMLNTEVNLRKESDRIKCTVEDCKLRQPPIKKETA